MKKILLGIGAVATMAAPVATVISCGDDDNISSFSKDIRKIADAFSNTKDQRTDVRSQWDELKTEDARISNIKDQTEKDAARLKFNKEIFSQLISYDLSANINKLAFTTDGDDVTAFKAFFTKAKNASDTMTDKASAEKYGLSLEEAAKVKINIDALTNVNAASSYDNRAVIIWINIEKNAATILNAIADTASADVSTAFAAIKDAYNVDESQPRSFILAVSSILNSGDKFADPKGKFVNSTSDADVNTWKDIFNEISIVAKSFKTSESAMAYGFNSLEDAMKASQRAETMSKIEKSTDANGVTISTT